jgi:hypothetical protein
MGMVLAPSKSIKKKPVEAEKAAESEKVTNPE